MIWKPHVTVAAVIHNDGRYLLVEEEIRGKRVYNQPAGHLEPAESLADAARREAFEETGHTLDLEALLGIYQWRNGHNDKEFVRVTFIARSSGFDAEAKLDDGIIRAVWLTRAEIEASSDRLRSPMVLRNIDDFERGQSYPLDLLRYIGTEHQSYAS